MKAAPSSALLREWAATTGNETCWGLDALADLLDEALVMRAALSKLVALVDEATLVFHDSLSRAEKSHALQALSFARATLARVEEA